MKVLTTIDLLALPSLETPPAGHVGFGAKTDGLYQKIGTVETKLSVDGHVHSAVTTSVAGFMSAADKVKLDGIATGANAYVHPTGAGYNHIPSGGAAGQFLKWSSSGVAVWAADNNTVYTHPATHPATIITEDASHRFVTDTEKSTWNAKSNLALGTTSTTAFRGDYGNTAYNHSITTGNPHGTTFAQLSGTPTTLAGYGITNAILFDDIIQNTNPFGGRKLYINSLDNALAGAAKKYFVTVTKHKKVVNTVTYPKPINVGNILLPQWEDSPVIATYDGDTLFDNVYEGGVACASDEYLKVALDFNAAGTAYFNGYPYGTYLLSYYYTNTPEKAEVRCYNGYAPHTTGYKTLSFSDYIGTNSSGGYIQQCADHGNYQRREIEFIIYGHPSHTTTLTEIEWKLGRPSFPSNTPLFTNYGWNKAYFPLYLGDQVTNKIILDPAGNITATAFTGALSGNASTATKLATARAINGVDFDGTAPITITANTPTTLTRGSYLTGSNFNGSTATTWAVDATSANTASKVVARDASGNFSAGTITASLSGNATTATTLQTSRTIWGQSFNGSANISGAITGATTGDFSDTITINKGTTVNSSLVLTANGTTTSFGSLNSSYFHINTDASAGFYFYKTITTPLTVTATTFIGALSGNATTATTATKLGTATVGSTQLPFYLNAGTATAITQANLRIGLFGTTAIGSSTKPIYINTNGVPTASTSFGGVTGIGTANPLMDGTVAVGTSSLAARQDHRHPVDTSRAAVGQTMYIGTTAVTINRASATLNLAGIGTLAMGGALSGATTIAASTSVTTPKVIFAAAGWSVEQSGTEIQFKYNGVIKQRLLNDGSIVGIGEITAFGSTT